MDDDDVDEISVQVAEDGTVHMKWKYSEGPYFDRHFNFAK